MSDSYGASARKETRPRVGVLLLNLGTPEATDYWSMRRYLKEFLWDHRVVENNRAMWWVILNVIILTTRPGRSGQNYKSIWNKERNESPLRTITRSMSEKLAAKLPEVELDWAMRYGVPTVSSRIEALKAKGCERILLFPLYPQYAASTTATACDAAFDALKQMRWQPTIRIVPPYYDDEAHITALARSVETGLAALDFEPEIILASFHGLPQAYVDKGDPYEAHCRETTRLLRRALDLDKQKLRLSFQSRMGKEQWLRPYTDETVIELARAGTKNLAVITPGFAADCVETLEEIAIEAGHLFKEAGGDKFAALPCLNDSAISIDMMQSIILRELKGWTLD